MAYARGRPLLPFRPGFLPFEALFHLLLLFVRAWNRTVYGMRIRGRAHLRGVPHAVVVSNHTLLVDPGLVAHALRPRRTYFTMLEETALIPHLGTFVRLLGAVPIPEGPGSLRAVAGAARGALDLLGLVHFFPEGECWEGNQDIRPFRPGAFLLAARLGVPVVPVTIVLHARARRRSPRLPPRVTVVIGQPARPPGQARAQVLAWAEGVRAGMQATIDGLGGSRLLFRGLMPRLVKRPAADGPSPGALAHVS